MRSKLTEGSSWGDTMQQLGQSAVGTAAGNNVQAKPSEPATASKCQWGAVKSHLTPQQRNGPSVSQNQTQLFIWARSLFLYLSLSTQNNRGFRIAKYLSTYLTLSVSECNLTLHFLSSQCKFPNSHCTFSQHCHPVTSFLACPVLPMELSAHTMKLCSELPK